MTVVANMRLATCRVRWRRGPGASLACPGRVLAALGPLLGSFWTLLGVSWAPFASFLNTLGRIWALMGASGLDFGGSLVPPGWVLSGLGVGESQSQFSPWFLAMPFARCR